VRNLLPAVLVAALLMAGCSDPGKATTEAPGAVVTASTMAIVGLVQDEALQPIAGANVTLRLLDRATVTDTTGGFRFDNLSISAYLVDVNATGFEPASLTAEPAIGQNSSLSFILLQQTSLRPRATVEHLEGVYQCGFEALIIPGSCDVLLEEAGQSAFDDTSTFQIGLDRRWQSVAVDVDFDLSANPGLEGLRLTVRGINDADKWNDYQEYGHFSGAEPFTAIVDVNGTYEDGDAAVPGNLTALELVVYPQGYGWHATCDVDERSCALGVGAGIDIQFDLYVTVFYNQRAPEGYTLLQA
jgi:Carboxypeptidase regulatory-like domain